MFKDGWKFLTAKYNSDLPTEISFSSRRARLRLFNSRCDNESVRLWALQGADCKVVRMCVFYECELIRPHKARRERENLGVAITLKTH